MSKTLGNVIDPIDTIKEYGTDALRFTIALGTAGQVCLSSQIMPACPWLAVCAHAWFLTNTNYATYFLQDLNLSMERLTANKAFTNKLWNAGKFVLQNLPSQSDNSAWETLSSYKVRSFSH